MNSGIAERLANELGYVEADNFDDELLEDAYPGKSVADIAQSRLCAYLSKTTYTINDMQTLIAAYVEGWEDRKENG